MVRTSGIWIEAHVQKTAPRPYDPMIGRDKSEVVNEDIVEFHKSNDPSGTVELNSTTLSGHAFLSLNQKALRRSHVFHGLQQRCGNTIQSHVQILTPCPEVYAVLPKST